MSIEKDLGTVIRMCNPYGKGKPKTMHFGLSKPPNFSEIKASFTASNNNSSINLSDFEVQVENYAGEWLFRGQSYRLNKAILIPYRCPLTDKDGELLPVFATQHLLIGYAGGNGP